MHLCISRKKEEKNQLAHQAQAIVFFLSGPGCPLLKVVSIED